MAYDNAISNEKKLFFTLKTYVKEWFINVFD